LVQGYVFSKPVAADQAPLVAAEIDLDAELIKSRRAQLAARL
jgi:hypothetical protein